MFIYSSFTSHFDILHVASRFSPAATARRRATWQTDVTSCHDRAFRLVVSFFGYCGSSSCSTASSAFNTSGAQPRLSTSSTKHISNAARIFTAKSTDNLYSSGGGLFPLLDPGIAARGFLKPNSDITTPSDHTVKLSQRRKTNGLVPFREAGKNTVGDVWVGG
jgi:hypothetical protein